LLDLVFIPDRIFPIFRMQFRFVLRVDMPVGFVDRRITIGFFFAVMERTPPIFNNLYQIGVPCEKSDGIRAVTRTIEHPKELDFTEWSFPRGFDDLRFERITIA